MALTLDELVEKYNAGTLTDAELQESGYMMDQVKEYAKKGSIELPVDANISNLSTRKANLDQRVFESSSAISHSNNVGMPIVQTLLR